MQNYIHITNIDTRGMMLKHLKCIFSCKNKEKDKQIPFFTKIYNLKVLIINNLKI